MLKNIYRTHSCNELNKSHIDQKVTLSGWVNSYRDHGGIKFIDLRDSFGIVQLTIEIEISQHITLESVIKVEGVVRTRNEDEVIKNIETGEIEVYVSAIE